MDPFLRTSSGDPVPGFRIENLEGGFFASRDDLKKVKLITFFIIKCPHCRDSLNFIGQEVWNRFDTGSFEMICIGRDHSVDDLRAFRKARDYRFPMAADPLRQVYDMFATQKVPRTFLVDRTGIIVHHTRGYNEEEYRGTIRMITDLISS